MLNRLVKICRRLVRQQNVKQVFFFPKNFCKEFPQLWPNANPARDEICSVRSFGRSIVNVCFICFVLKNSSFLKSEYECKVLLRVAWRGDPAPLLYEFVKVVIDWCYDGTWSKSLFSGNFVRDYPYSDQMLTLPVLRYAQYEASGAQSLISVLFVLF